MTRPLVSLCCSTCSRPDLFSHSLAGLRRQTYEPLEIVILVDGANPDSIAVLTQCKDPRLRWFTTPSPSGMIPAWNKVVSASRGEYFLFCADDDILSESAIDLQVQLLEANPNIGFCHADFFVIDDDGRQIREWRSHEGTWIKPGLKEWRRYLTQPKACMQTCVVRRTLWDQVHGWDEDAGYPGDNSLYLKLLRISDVGHVARHACSYRVRTHSPDSWEKNASKVKEDVALAVKHLADIPAPLRGDAGALRIMVLRYFARSALVVLADDRPSPAQRETFRRWVRDNLLDPMPRRSVYHLIFELQGERLVAIAQYLDFAMRALVRNRLASLRSQPWLRRARG